MEEFNKEKEDEEPKGDEIMTVEETAHYLKTTTQTIYRLVKKGKLDKMGISTVDKPNARASIGIRKKELDRFLKG